MRDRIINAAIIATLLIFAWSHGYFFAGWERYQDYRGIYSEAMGDL